MNKDLHIEGLEALVYKLKKENVDLAAAEECRFNESMELIRIGVKLNKDRYLDLVGSSEALTQKEKAAIIEVACG